MDFSRWTSETCARGYILRTWGVTAERRQEPPTYKSQRLHADAGSGRRRPGVIPDPPFLYLVPVPILGYSRFSSSEHHVGPKMTIDCGAAAFVIRLGWI